MSVPGKPPEKGPEKKKPEIVYPCLWQYAVIGLVKEDLRQAILSVVRGREHALQYSKTSAQGKYCSFHLQLEVADEADRNRLFAALQRARGVKMVL